MKSEGDTNVRKGEKEEMVERERRKMEGKNKRYAIW